MEDASGDGAPRKIKAMRIATRCTTVDEFVAGFQPYCDGATCFIPTLGMRPVGLESAFAILLADGTPMLRGLCVIQDAWETADNPFKRPGLRVKLVRLTPDSNELLGVIRGYARGPRTDEFEAPKTLETPIPVRPPPTPTPMPPRAEEQRTPGSPYILPANPFTALSDESLGAFVDCMLTEDNSEIAAEPEQWGDVTAPDQPLQPSVIQQVLATRAAAAAAANSRAGIATLMGVAPLTATPTEPPPPPPPPPPLPAPAPPLIERPVAIVPAEDPITPPMRWGLITGIAIGVVAILIAVVIWLVAFHGKRSSTVAVAPAPATAKADAPPAVPAAPEARVALPPGPAPTTPKPREEPDLPIAGSGPCRMVIASTPAGAIVSVDGDVVGPTPITVDGPCHERKLELAHPRYDKLVHVVTPIEGAPSNLELTLLRPTHMLKVTSTPSGATVSINGHRAGATPAMVSVMGFSSLTLTVDKYGYRTLTKRIYSQLPTEVMAFTLVHL